MSTSSAQKPIPGYSPARAAGELVYVSGALGLDPETGAIPEGSFDKEAHQVMQNLLSNAAAAGATAGDIVKTTVYVTTFDIYGEFDRVYRTYFPGQLPARATVEVAGLLAGARVEIEAVAWLDPAAQTV
ncbi:Rid family detoxifying hydrolase [Nocardioides sp. T5]|uniref:Rid family detoxifying hydrolase n=1 Tax=Nocardioides sp. T5 TaxID=3400182 RepID=UPI003A847271